MKIFSFGDRIVPGTFRVHSIFSKAVNFIDPEDKTIFAVSIVSPEVGGGPINIVLENFSAFHFTRDDELTITKDHIIFRGEKIGYTGKLYRSKVELSSPSKRSIRAFHKILMSKHKTKSLNFLIDEKKEKDFTSTFEKAFVKQMKEGVTRAFSTDFEHGVDEVRGIGVGLTPSGDDFLSGLLLSFHIDRNEELVDRVFTKAISTSPFSNTAIYYAREGAVHEPMKKLIEAILFKNEEIDKCTDQLMTVGDTSGIDQSVGLLMGLRRRE